MIMTTKREQFCLSHTTLPHPYYEGEILVLVDGLFLWNVSVVVQLVEDVMIPELLLALKWWVLQNGIPTL